MSQKIMSALKCAIFCGSLSWISNMYIFAPSMSFSDKWLEIGLASIFGAIIGYSSTY